MAFVVAFRVGGCCGIERNTHLCLPYDDDHPKNCMDQKTSIHNNRLTDRQTENELAKSRLGEKLPVPKACFRISKSRTIGHLCKFL